MNTKKQYITPMLTVVTFKAERGYAGSLDPNKLLSFRMVSSLLSGSAVDNTQETWTEEQELFTTW